MLPGERHRERVLSFQEEARYLAVASEPLCWIATVLSDTGMRPEECYRLRWETITWVNGRNGSLLVTHGKTKAARRVLPFTRVSEQFCKHDGKVRDNRKRAGFGPHWQRAATWNHAA